MDIQATLNALAERVARLEAAKPRKRAFNLQEAAREVGMSTSKFRKQYVKTGKVKGTRDRRIWRFSDKALEELLTAEQAKSD